MRFVNHNPFAKDSCKRKLIPVLRFSSQLKDRGSSCARHSASSAALATGLAAPAAASSYSAQLASPATRQDHRARHRLELRPGAPAQARPTKAARWCCASRSPSAPAGSTPSPSTAAHVSKPGSTECNSLGQARQAFAARRQIIPSGLRARSRLPASPLSSRRRPHPFALANPPPLTPSCSHAAPI